MRTHARPAAGRHSLSLMNLTHFFSPAPDGCRRRLLATLLAVPALPALAQFRVEVSGVGLTQMPIALVPFRGEAGSPQAISAIVRADLERSGQFRGVDAAGASMDETTRPDMASWRQRSADALAGGSVTRLPDGRWDVRFRLWDVVRDADLGGQGYVVPQADLRLAAHKSADHIYEKLTGDKGVFSTRIAYVTQNGKRYFQGNGNFISLPPEAKANAMMKAETKAKRRVTLSICGLGMLDESEFDTIRNTRPIETPDETLSLRLSEETAKVEVMHSPKQLSPPASDQKPTRKPKAEEQIAPRLAELWAQCDSDIPGALTSINDEISGKVGDDDAERAWVNALKANKVANWEHMDVATAKKVVRDLWSYSIRVQREPVAEQ